MIVNYNNQDDYKDDDDDDDDEEEEDIGCLCEVQLQPQWGPWAKCCQTFDVVVGDDDDGDDCDDGGGSGNDEVDNDDDDKEVEKDEYCLTQEKRRMLSLAKNLEAVEQTKALNKKIAEKQDCLQHLSQSGSCTPGQPQNSWPPELCLWATLVPNLSFLPISSLPSAYLPSSEAWQSDISPSVFPSWSSQQLASPSWSSQLHFQYVCPAASPLAPGYHLGISTWASLISFGIFPLR